MPQRFIFTLTACYTGVNQALQSCRINTAYRVDPSGVRRNSYLQVVPVNSSVKQELLCHSETGSGILLESSAQEFVQHTCMMGFPPSSRAMANRMLSWKMRSLLAFMMRSMTRSDAPSLSRWHCTSARLSSPRDPTEQAEDAKGGKKSGVG